MTDNGPRDLWESHWPSTTDATAATRTSRRSRRPTRRLKTHQAMKTSMTTRRAALCDMKRVKVGMSMAAETATYAQYNAISVTGSHSRGRGEAAGGLAASDGTGETACAVTGPLVGEGRSVTQNRAEG